LVTIAARAARLIRGGVPTDAEMKEIVNMLHHGGRAEVRLTDEEGVFLVRQRDRPRDEVNRVEVMGKTIILWEVDMDDPETAADVEEKWAAGEVVTED
jgi:hypothetical protein